MPVPALRLQQPGAAQPASRRSAGLLLVKQHAAAACRRSRATQLAGGLRNIAAQCLQADRPAREEPAAPLGRPRPKQLPTYARFDSGSGAAEIHVFGLCHLEAEAAAAEFIWRSRPAVVAVESAVTQQHGALTGALLSADDFPQQAQDFRLRMLCQIAARLDTDVPPEANDTWQVLKQQFPGEQLVYIAAFAVGAQLMFADRPKDITLQRLHNLTSLEDLDLAFGRLSADNYQETLSRHGVNHSSFAPSSAPTDCVHAIMIAERDAVLAHSLRAAADLAGPSGAVVAVVGLDHLPGVEWVLRRQQRPDGAALAALQGPGMPPMERAVTAGTRRALLAAVLRLCTSDEVLAEADRVLGPLLPGQQLPHDIATEIYGSTRMLLAGLPREGLEAVCSGWRCDMWEVLSPLRGVRPSNGGTGCDEELAIELQMLYVDVNPQYE